MEFVAYLAGESHSDSPECVDPALRRLVIGLNDHLPDDLRQQLLPYLVRTIGTAGDGGAQERLYMMINWALRVVAPAALEARGGHKNWAEKLRAVEPVVDMATMRAAEPVARDAASYVVPDGSSHPVFIAACAVTYAVRDNDVEVANNIMSAAYRAANDDPAENDDAKRAMWVKLLPSALDLLDRMLGDEIVALRPGEGN